MCPPIITMSYCNNNILCVNIEFWCLLYTYSLWVLFYCFCRRPEEEGHTRRYVTCFVHTLYQHTNITSHNTKLPRATVIIIVEAHPPCSAIVLLDTVCVVVIKWEESFVNIDYSYCFWGILKAIGTLQFVYDLMVSFLHHIIVNLMTVKIQAHISHVTLCWLSDFDNRL